MNVDEIIELMQATSENGLISLELKKEEPGLLLECEEGTPQIATISASSASVVSMQIAAMWNGLAGPSITSPAMMLQDVASPQTARDIASSVSIGSDKVATSPLVGTFYNASPSNAAPFVQAGSTVEKGQVLGIIKAMKLMDEVESEYDGVVETALVNNKEVVEYGQPLFRTK